jgi:hypothetical protein
MTSGLTGLNIIVTTSCRQSPTNGGGIFKSGGLDDSFSALVAIAFALAVFVGGSLAQAQKASDPKSQPGSGQCRLSNGQKC